MKSAPAWITYVTAVVAVLALLVSFATYLRAGPRVRVRMRPPHRQRSDKDSDLTVTVTNKGLAPVDVLAIILGFVAGPGFFRITELSEEHRHSGEDLPHRLLPGSQKEWSYRIGEQVKQRIIRLADVDLSKDSKEEIDEKIKKALDKIRPWPRVLGLKSWGKMFIPMPLQLISSYGVLVAVDLGNGSQATSFPSWRFAFWLLRLIDSIHPLDESQNKL